MLVSAGLIVALAAALSAPGTASSAPVPAQQLYAGSG